MKITLIRPAMTSGISKDAIEPLVFGILAALTPPRIRLKFYDERIEPIVFDEHTDLVALSVDTYSARRAYQIATYYRRLGVSVVMGGYHPTLCTEESLHFADAVVVGDAEDTWPAVIEDFCKGQLQQVYRSQYPSLTGLHINRTIFGGKRYGPMRLVQFGRGCSHSCDFCSIHAFYGSSIRYRPVDETVAEVKELGASGTRGIIFTDDNLFAKKSEALELLQRLKPVGIRWSCQTELDVASSETILGIMAESGCLSVTVGFETLKDENLAQMHKSRKQKADRYEELIRRFHAHGIMVYGTFVFGYDHDTNMDFERSLDFVMKQKLFLANFNPLTPMPGTPLYMRLQKEKRLIHDCWWRDSSYRYGEATFHPHGMSAQELTDGCYRARTQLNSLGSILWRGLNTQANIRSFYNAGAYLIGNFVNRREIHRKQGVRLGDPEDFKGEMAIR